MCGIIGIYSPNIDEKIPLKACEALFGLQHRGQETAGLAWVQPEKGLIRTRKNLGLVTQALDPSIRPYGPSHVAIGHCRYSTTGGGGLANAQPLRATCSQGHVAIAHNGNISNATALRSELQHKGAIFQSTADTEIILHLMAHRSDLSLKKALISALKRLEGGWALALIIDNELVVARDTHGIRPLILGKLDDLWIAASETCAIEQIGGEVIADVKAGEVLCLTKEGPELIYRIKPQPKKICAFEYVYFARPDSLLEGQSVYETRIALGQSLAKSSPIDADFVCGMPDSGRISAMGYARALSLPFEEAIMRNHFVGRSFILPTQDARIQAVRQKLRPVHNLLRGKKIVVVDDSIVRATTSHYIINMLKEAGAKEVHMRIASPPVRWPCFYGIDMPDQSQLASFNHSEEELCQKIGATTLKWLELKDLGSSIHQQQDNICNACFTGQYLWETKNEQSL